jgi:hypothetical protein
MAHCTEHRLNTPQCARTVTQHHSALPCMLAAIIAFCMAPATFTLAAKNTSSTAQSAATKSRPELPAKCLPAGGAFLRARLNGAINTELSWNDRNLICAGSVRPNDEGIRLRFAATKGSQQLVLLFGITGLKEGQAGKALPANLTIMREGSGEFYGTQGDNKCTIDEVSQQPLQGAPLRQRAYRVTARGFCTQPARALNGDGAILVTRFDFSGRADFASDDDAAAGSSSSATSRPTLPTT